MVCVVGSCNMDLVTYSATLPRDGETVRGGDFKLGFGGKGANQCVAAGLLGGRVAMVGRVGDDTFGRDTLANFSRLGVDTAHVLMTPGAPTGVAQITVDTRTGHNSIIIVPGANDKLSPADASAAIDELLLPPPPQVQQQQQQHPDTLRAVLVVQLEVPLRTTAAALRAAKARNPSVLTLVNPAPAGGLECESEDPADLRDFYALADVFLPNETELETVAGMPVRSIADAEAAARRVVVDGFAMGACGARPGAVVVTLGENGCLLVRRDGSVLHVPQPERVPHDKVVDTTGAGDAFIGALAFFLSLGDALETALPKANLVAGRSVQRHGTQTSYASRQELPATIFT